MFEKTDRRGFLSKTLLGAVGVGAACSLEEKILMAALDNKADQGEKPKVDIAPGSMPTGKIGKVTISRLFLGGNLIGGWAHSRDLLYVSNLFKAYNTEEKCFQTMELAEQCGINTVLLDPRDWEVALKYKQQRGGKIQSMICIFPDKDRTKMRDQIKQLVDKGATLLYTHGELTDRHTMVGEVDVLGDAIRLMQEAGVPAGIGSHSLETPIACEKDKLNPDFYVKTFHMDRYWSATPKENREEWCWYKAGSSEHDKFHDNMWCLDPEKTAQFMESVGKPWVAFKVMAAGAIQPRMAFSYAFMNGADFVVAGMFDFQVEQDAKIAIEAIGKIHNRKRPWRA
ncbi:MAG: hypothetical protein NTY19_40640 [Planctomycetota bacterium]|nr:hypothetical protein [Planctomycetota bacterium]